MLPLLVTELDEDLGPLEVRRRAGQRPERRGGPPLPSDHATEVARRHEQLDDRLAAVHALDHAHGVGMIRQRASDDLDDVARAAHDAGVSAFAAAADSSASGCAGASGIRATSVRTVSDGRAPFFSQ